MRAAWYERRGPARDVLVVGDMPTPEPGAGEVRIRLAFSGINPGDVKKRGGWQGSPMPFPRVVPHSDGAGVIDAVGTGVPAARVGETVWCYGAQSYRAFGTAAEHVVVPAGLAVPLPEAARSQPDLLEQAACLGIAGITGHRAVFAAGPVAGLDVLVWGAASGVGAVALQMAHRAGARVLAVVRRRGAVAVGARDGRGRGLAGRRSGTRGPDPPCGPRGCASRRRGRLRRAHRRQRRGHGDRRRHQRLLLVRRPPRASRTGSWPSPTSRCACWEATTSRRR